MGTTDVLRFRSETSAAKQREEQLTGLLEMVRAHRHWPSVPAPAILECTSEELRQLMAQEVTNEVPREVALARDRGLTILGLLPRGYDTTSTVLDSFCQSVLGVYLSSQKTVALRMNRAPTAMADTLIHEFAHWAQDTLFGLGSRLKFSAQHADRISALHALAEGEATRIQVELGPRGPSDPGVSDDDVLRLLRSSVAELEGPAFVRRSVIAPYVDGYRFVSYLKQVGGWQLVDQVWERGLSNTSEVLHPERWVTKTGPLPPPESPLLPSRRLESVVVGDSELELHESWGEQGLRILLEDALAEPEAARLASDWVRDSYWLLREGGRRKLAWLIEVTSSEQARRLVAALTLQFFGVLESGPGCRHGFNATIALQVNRQDIVVTASDESDTPAASGTPSSCASHLRWGAAILRSL
ncbi:MAG TPA: hypothetical protein VIV60_36135 [Polyangiaceae bacterium]